MVRQLHSSMGYYRRGRIMPQINLSIEEHQSLTRLLSHPKTMKYRSDLYDTDTFDSMEDKVFDAVNNLTVEDF